MISLPMPEFYRSPHYIYLFKTEEDMSLAMTFPSPNDEHAGPTGFAAKNLDDFQKFGWQGKTIDVDLYYWYVRIGVKIHPIRPGEVIFAVEQSKYMERFARRLSPARQWTAAKVISGDKIGWIVLKEWMELEPVRNVTQTLHN